MVRVRVRVRVRVSCLEHHAEMVPTQEIGTHGDGVSFPHRLVLGQNSQHLHLAESLPIVGRFVLHHFHRHRLVGFYVDTFNHLAERRAGIGIRIRVRVRVRKPGRRCPIRGGLESYICAVLGCLLRCHSRTGCNRGCYYPSLRRE